MFYLIAQGIGILWMLVTAFVILAILVDECATRMREQRLRWQRQRDQRRFDIEFTKMMRHPASAGRDFLSGEWR